MDCVSAAYGGLKAIFNRCYPSDEIIDELPFESKAQWMALRQEVEGLRERMPPDALNALIQELGPKHVAELTGRTLTLKRQGRRGKYMPTNRVKDNLREKNDFLTGKKRVIIISRAGGAGISLHAGNKFRNQDQRLCILLELPWSADRAVQVFGRAHRSNQKHAPQFLVLASDIAGICLHLYIFFDHIFS